MQLARQVKITASAPNNDLYLTPGVKQMCIVLLHACALHARFLHHKMAQILKVKQTKSGNGGERSEGKPKHRLTKA